jgi:transposase
MKIVMLGIDLGKNLCSLAGLDETGAVVFRRRMKRESVLQFTAQLESCTVAIEACCGAHHLGRQLIAQRHVVRLMSPAYVRPYVKAQKNDERDAEAIAEAATRPTMRYVEVKSEAQLEVQSLHRVRERLVAERTALINQLRSLMLERGITVPQGRCKLERHLPEILSNVRQYADARDSRQSLGSVLGTCPLGENRGFYASANAVTATCGCCRSTGRARLSRVSPRKILRSAGGLRIYLHERTATS